jgi:hypothetical protein
MTSLLEEAQDLDTTLVQKSIEPMVSAVGGTIIKCGTTGTSKSDFGRRYNTILSDRYKLLMDV